MRSVTIGVISKRESSGMSGVTTVTLASASVRASATRRGSSMPAGCSPRDEQHGLTSRSQRGAYTRARIDPVFDGDARAIAR